MEIGKENVTAVFGPYIQPMVTSSERYGIPYFVMNAVTQQQYFPYNLIRVFLEPSQIYNIAVEVIDRYNLEEIAVFYEDSYGMMFG